jgi:hypothetical protein
MAEERKPLDPARFGDFANPSVLGFVRVAIPTVAVAVGLTTIFTATANGYYRIVMHNPSVQNTNSVVVADMIFFNGTLYAAGAPFLGALMAVGYAGANFQASNSAGPVSERASVFFMPLD